MRQIFGRIKERFSREEQPTRANDEPLSPAKADDPGAGRQFGNLTLFFPMAPEQDSFVLPKFPETNAPTCDRGLPLPPIPLLLGHDSVEQFLEYGAQHVGNMRRILDKAGFRFEPGQRILDFGCGSGRMLRQLYDFTPHSEFWGVDIRAEHIFWCKQHLSPPYRFAVTTTIPHLPFEDNSFDLIYTGSVFTHIDDLADAWFLELRRILRPGGFLYFTIHDNRSIELTKTTLRDHPLIGKQFMGHPKFEEYVNSDFGMFTLWRSADSQVFYDREYIVERIQLFYQVVSVNEEAYGFQTGILVSKRDSMRHGKAEGH
jgi:ubiquinone/menaquinone biosynthesis C-methylase UbiE